MSYSLLAHLYPHIRGSQEDIATLSLQYILMQSKELNQAFTKRIAEVMKIDLEDTLQYICQVTGASEEKERPDMAGLNAIGDEVVLCEMKFYATLTSNQPNTYLKRLQENDGKGLIFVCPEARKTSLWAKLNELCEGDEIKKISDTCIDVDGVKLAIITWAEIIERLMVVASSVAVELIHDIKQLKGYCEQLDRDAFIPVSDVDLSAQMANKAERYYQVLDEVIDLLCADEKFETSTKNLKASPSRKGYVRYLYLDDFSIALKYDRELWKNPTTIETPFWISIRDKEWDQPKEFIKVLNKIPKHHKQESWGYIDIALEPLQDVTLSEVCEDLKNKIANYIDMFR